MMCPSCKEDALTPYFGGQFGKNICKNCGWIGALEIEENIKRKDNLTKKR